MSCKRGQISLVETLRHVFLTVPNIRSHIIQPTRSFKHLQHRTYNATTQRPPVRRFARPGPAAAIDPKNFGPVGYNKQMKDEEIPSTRVCMIGNDGKISRPQYKDEILGTFDRKQYFLIQVDLNEQNVPVCKIEPKKKIFEMEKAANNDRSKTARDRKEVEIPWKAAEADVDRKISVAVDFVDEGRKVDVVLIARRPREIVKDPIEAQQIVDQVQRRLAKYEHIQATRDESSIMGKSVTIHLEGPSKNKAKKDKKQQKKTPKQIEVPWNITEEDLERKRFRVEELLKGGIPVDLVVGSKRKTFQVDEEEGDKVISTVMSQMSQLPAGVREAAAREGEPGKMVTIHFEYQQPLSARQRGPKDTEAIRGD